MKAKTPGLLWDIRRACQFVIENTNGQSAETIAADIMLRSAIERQIEIAPVDLPTMTAKSAAP